MPTSRRKKTGFTVPEKAEVPEVVEEVMAAPEPEVELPKPKPVMIIGGLPPTPAAKEEVVEVEKQTRRPRNTPRFNSYS